MPDVGNPVNAPVMWWDRAVDGFVLTFNATGVNPHAITNRWTYTVPANRKAWASLGDLVICRQVAAAPNGLCAGIISMTRFAHPNANWLYCELITNLAGERVTLSPPGPVLLHAGDVINFGTLDLGTGSITDYFSHCDIVEFYA